ncbi:damage-control phosphatase ARMT1 family protein [Streptacidiphilus sp. P02-A3a]|uniref:damage-control phosphatase ARMT1 family protein n=1 Tax=Streptacidiphilus sp. P02-A3a TaxID=2704468 RepID=UPI0015F9A413|nr:damage-control phosphatase ARMT1 family protein [Streptacidiphilus sp. P02-A3a]QMU66922.1 protein-glutamate O-methyltransferase family protein [Streptacidiphilus sp. P02-A3a]
MSTAPVIRSDVPGSFAWGVFHERHPELVRRVLDALPYGPVQRAGVERLLEESTTGVLEPLAADAPDAEQWREWGAGLWGRPWGEAPFLWAESYFYRRLLDATGYFRPGAWQGVDPFAPFKAAELAGAAVDAELTALGGLDGLPEGQRAEALLRSALWGNRADLSFQLTAGAAGSSGSELVADDSALFWGTLERAEGGRVCVVADNAGRELLPDLVLIDHLLARGLATRVVVQVKPQPYYVSDATMADVLAAVQRLRGATGAAAAAVGRRLWRAMDHGTLVVRAHPFLCAPLPFHDLPADLREEFTGAELTILKGDLNYRRLVGDQQWSPTTPFPAAGGFRSPVAALRTLKSDVVVGLDAATVDRLDRTGTPWRTNGRHAVVQVGPGESRAGTGGSDTNHVKKL